MWKAKTWAWALIACGVICVGLPAGAALANGTEGLGPASIAINPGTGIVAAGTGMVSPPGIININVPAGATVSQVIVYWEGLSTTAVGGDNAILVNGVPVSADLPGGIGGPTEFFANAWSTSYRADITAQSNANNWIVPGANVVTIDGFDFDQTNDGCGILVIYDEGGTPATVDIRDGNDLAFAFFAPTLDATVPQTFTFAAAPFARQADVALFVGSVNLNRSSLIRFTSGGNVTEIKDILGNTDGPEWDTVSSSVTVPAGATQLTIEAISGPIGDPLQPASLSWITGAVAILPAPLDGTIIINKTTVPPGGAGFTYTDDIALPNSFGLNDGDSEVFNNVPAGTYTVAENDPMVTPGGYELTSLVCVDDDPAGTPSTTDLSSRTATINLDPGETVTCSYVNSAPSNECRVKACEKGSLLIYPKVELRWDAQGNLIQDTFLSLINDYPDDVLVQMYFINGDGPTSGESPCEHRIVLYDAYGDGWNGNSLDVSVNGSPVLNDITLPNGPGPLALSFVAGTGDSIATTFDDSGDYDGECYYEVYGGNGAVLGASLGSGSSGPPDLQVTGICDVAHPGWNWVDVEIPLTGNEPTYWSAATGGPIGTQPFTILDPDDGLPGRPDPNVPGERMLRGYVIAWAVNDAGEEIRWNHLTGSATLVNYLYAAAWEYCTYGFQATTAVAHGAPLGSPGELFLDNTEYCATYSQLLFDFFAVDSFALSGEYQAVSVNTDLTLLPVPVDLRQETEGPVTTKAHFDIWDMNEFKKSGTYRCVTCWDQTLLGDYGVPNNFLIENLWTDKGKARITGQASQLCDLDYDPADGPLGSDPRDVISEAAPLLGVIAKHLSFSYNLLTEPIAAGEDTPSNGMEEADFGYAGMNLVGMGSEGTVIRADLVNNGSPPPEAPDGQIESKPSIEQTTVDRPRKVVKVSGDQ